MRNPTNSIHFAFQELMRNLNIQNSANSPRKSQRLRNIRLISAKNGAPINLFHLTNLHPQNLEEGEEEKSNNVIEEHNYNKYAFGPMPLA